MFSFDLGNEQSAYFLVTNKHVVQGTAKGRFFFTRRDGDNPVIGQRWDVELDAFETRWHGHPKSDVDVAVMPLVPLLEFAEASGQNVFFRSVPDSLVPTPDQLKELDAIEEVMFVGYPSGIYDNVNLMPIVRRGTTATPLQLDYDGRPVFLVDASVFPGSSGSPVVLWNRGSYTTRDGGVVIGSRFFLLGIMAEVAFREEHGQIDFVSIPTANVPVVRTKEMIDLGVVYKSSAILEAAADFLRSRHLL